MKVSGFTFLRNAVKLGYPFEASVLSVLPLVDEFIIALGPCEDNTKERLLALKSPKIKIIDTVWDESLRAGGAVYAKETDKAKAECSKDSDWLIYIQGDEVIHEQYYSTIRHEMLNNLGKRSVEGLLLKYLHFYGDFNHMVISRKWYRREIRIIKNLPEIHSWRDAMGFRLSGRKIAAKLIDATVYHYGWIKPPKLMAAKEQAVKRYWVADGNLEQVQAGYDNFEYEQLYGLQKFIGNHPEVMKDYLKEYGFKAQFKKEAKPDMKTAVFGLIEKLTGKRLFEYKNYRLLK